jgi:stage II sporulation protein D
VAAPIIRVGILTEVPRASLAADSGVVVWRLGSSAPQAPRLVQRATFVASGGDPAALRLLETGEPYGSVLVLAQVPAEALSVDGSGYRGVLEVRADGASKLTVINVINLEEYLRGVVPNELSPQVFPEPEALKAQAVAARTYALRNHGQFMSKGYDICATPACQVYRGLASEHALTDHAVAETRGVAVSYRGALINALYTSTCGGHTEDGENIFEGPANPYLRGVACAPEKASWGLVRTTASPKALGSETGLNRDVALLVALGVFERRACAPRSLQGIPSDDEVRAWTAKLLSALRRRGCESRSEASLTRRGTFAQHLVESLCWAERARLLSPADPDYLLQVEDRAALLGESEKLSAALLIHEGILSPLPDNTLRPNLAVTRAQAAGILARTAVKAGIPALVTATFSRSAEGQLTVTRDDVAESHPLATDLALFRSLDGLHVPASEVSPTPGDKVVFIVKDGRVAFLEAEQPRLGAASDRTSRYYRWEVRLTPEEVAKSVARYGDVGTVKDVLPRRIGVSGRVVELAILGTGGELVLKGLKVRWALGLRENLFVVDRERDPHGAVERFVFTGKGWGHGVGLCQVGAFGMAQAGASYERILQHYYAGATLEKAY